MLFAIIEGSDQTELLLKINVFIADKEVVDIKVDHENYKADILYKSETETKPKKRMLCCECQYWDDTQSENSLMGFCTITGKRCRYNQDGCDKYLDVRD